MFRRGLNKAAWLLLIPLAAGAVWVGETGLIFFSAALGVAPWALRARWRWRPTALLLVAPLLVTGSALHAGWTYAVGAARVEFSGGPFCPEDGNLDWQTRLLRRGLGCKRTSLEPFTRDVNNAALRGPTQSFGPMEGTYDGPYLTLQEATRFLTLEGQTVQLGDLKGAHLRVGRKTLDVAPDVAQEIIEETPDVREAWAAILQGRLLVLHVEKSIGSHLGRYPRDFQAGNMTYLVDLNRSGLVARYWTGEPWALPEGIDFDGREP
jgi:hypothetical protein